jgi:ubiquinone/menaquinone biosynthesis C-methylase UbiE
VSGASGLPGVIPSPNIWNHPEVYEVENGGVDPDGRIETAMTRVHDWRGEHLLDVGCGAGFHLPRFAATAAAVTGVEPHGPLVRAARRRVTALDPVVAQRITVLSGSAEQLPLADSSVDVVHARWAYFFGPGCEPGLRELARVVRGGGTAFVVDNDATRSTFGRWFRRALPTYDPVAVERFWSRHGWRREPVEMRWQFADRATFERVVAIEFAPDQADAILAEHAGAQVDYAVVVRWKRF